VPETFKDYISTPKRMVINPSIQQYSD